MSFLTTANRSYDPLSQPDMATLRRASLDPAGNFANVSQPPMHPLVHQHSSNHQSHPADRSRLSLPEIGQTRCCA